MKRSGVLVLMALCVVVLVSESFAEIREVESTSVSIGDTGEGLDRVLCIDGFKIFQTVAFGFGPGAGAAVSNIQIMNEENGKLVPVRCKVKKKTKK